MSSKYSNFKFDYEVDQAMTVLNLIFCKLDLIMRQVPHYAIIGSGRMATHMCRYFDYLSLHYNCWRRSADDSSKLNIILQQATHALILINDQAIDPFIAQYLGCYSHLVVVHFSAALSSTFAYRTHPLQTFSLGRLYDKDAYENIPFIIEKTAPEFSELLPGLSNSHYRIANDQRAYYHAVCVLANNISTLLWQKFYQEMTTRFAISEKDLLPFLSCTFDNIRHHHQQALTGPLVRKDCTTLKRNLEAMADDPFYPLLNEAIKLFLPRGLS